MPVQHSLCFDPAGEPAVRPSPVMREGAGRVVLVTGNAINESCARLLDRALVDSGLAEHEPVELAPGAALAPAQRRSGPSGSRLVVAFGAEAACAFLGRPVSLNLERGRVRPLPDGGRVLVTEHPRAILGLTDPVARGREYRRLVNDLLLAVPHRRLAA